MGGPSLRRFFINTLFDSTFMLLGVVIASAFEGTPDLHLVLGTLVASSASLGISSGVSVYESETLELDRRIVELEKALFRNLDNTMISENHKSSARMIATVNFLTPLICCGIVSVPLLLATGNLLDSVSASWVSTVLALSILFVAGTFLGRRGKKNAFLKGLRMLIFGIIAFLLSFLIQILI